MGAYSNLIAKMEEDINRKQKYTVLYDEAKKSNEKAVEDEVILTQAIQIFSAISDQQLNNLIVSLESFINRVISEIFPAGDRYTVAINKTVSKDNTPRLNVKLYDEYGHEMNASKGVGRGLQQIVSVVFSLIVVSLREDRPIIIFDEVLGGLHNQAKNYMKKLIQLFSNNMGYQFFMIEYNFDDTGKIYNVEKKDGIAQVLPVTGEYNPNMIYLDEPDLDVLDSNYIEEED